MNGLRALYSHSGHVNGGGITAEQVVAREKSFPNSTLDAEDYISALMAFDSLDGARRRTPPEDKKFLDVGCGYGFFSREAKAAGMQVTALECAEAERTIARAVARVDPLPVLFEDYEGAPASFDVVLMSQVLEHAFDVNRWIRQAATLLKPGGLICIAVPNFNFPQASARFVYHTTRTLEPFLRQQPATATAKAPTLARQERNTQSLILRWGV